MITYAIDTDEHRHILRRVPDAGRGCLPRCTWRFKERRRSKYAYDVDILPRSPTDHSDHWGESRGCQVDNYRPPERFICELDSERGASARGLTTMFVILLFCDRRGSGLKDLKSRLKHLTVTDKKYRNERL